MRHVRPLPSQAFNEAPADSKPSTHAFIANLSMTAQRSKFEVNALISASSFPSELPTSKSTLTTGHRGVANTNADMPTGAWQSTDARALVSAAMHATCPPCAAQASAVLPIMSCLFTDRVHAQVGPRHAKAPERLCEAAPTEPAMRRLARHLLRNAQGSDQMNLKDKVQAGNKKDVESLLHMGNGFLGLSTHNVMQSRAPACIALSQVCTTVQHEPDDSWVERLRGIHQDIFAFLVSAAYVTVWKQRFDAEQLPEDNCKHQWALAMGVRDQS
eukprot:CAMPEP_0203906864 /NCGR_PEP_ID=MMETSP0359-20131031/48429_1 /ASSEMBLY_ACC=CAM_ASM_000338 /TAXON_ID=268821 /ORGANISM="Scrippsiella Hangoei, Strain SHTV-5" /LENGTH=271 /DNA_ID=CAMNT_0050831581 /DNA_START=582 /DNA_END=1399 /DNA_ORIENTATION=-